MDIYHSTEFYPAIRPAVAKVIKDLNLDFIEPHGGGDQSWIELYMNPRKMREYPTWGEYLEEYVRQYDKLSDALQAHRGFDFKLEDKRMRPDREEEYINYMTGDPQYVDKLLDY